MKVSTRSSIRHPSHKTEDDLARTVSATQKLTRVQERAENLITLPEKSDVVRSMLTFLYSGDYDHPRLGSYGEDTLHHAELYTMALKYNITPLCSIVRGRLEEKFGRCHDAFYTSVRIHKIKQPGDTPVAITKQQLDKSVNSFQALLIAVQTLLENTFEDDEIRLALLGIDFSGVMPVGKYRAPWFNFVAEHAEYAADSMMFRINPHYAAVRRAEFQNKKMMKLALTPPSTGVQYIPSINDSSLSDGDG